MAAEKKSTKSKSKPKTQDVVIDAVVQSSEQKQLPTLRRPDGSSLELTVENIQAMGTGYGDGLANLSNQVLSKVKVSNSGEFGEGINTILGITRSVDVSALGNQRKGVIGKVLNIFSNTQQKVLDQFNTSADQIEQISGVLREGIERMRGESVWLNEIYDENIRHLRSLEMVLENVEEVLEIEDEKLSELLKEGANPAIEVLDHQRSITTALDKQADKLRRLIQLSKLQAPQIASMRGVNTNTIEKFESLDTIIIPAWKSQMSLGLISQQQKKDNELSKSMDDETNRLLVANSEQVSANMKDAALSAQRGVVDIESLVKIQNNTLSGITETIAIENRGREERAKAAVLLEKMDNDLRSALMEISVNKSKSK